MEDLACDCFPDHLGLLNAIGANSSAALSCTGFGFTGEVLDVPGGPQLSKAGVRALAGW